MRTPWATDDGNPYGVPFIATSHGIYYNVDAFKTPNLAVPTTWQELLDVAKIIHDAGIIPFANASGDKRTCDLSGKSYWKVPQVDTNSFKTE